MLLILLVLCALNVGTLLFAVRSIRAIGRRLDHVLAEVRRPALPEAVKAVLTERVHAEVAAVTSRGREILRGRLEARRAGRS